MDQAMATGVCVSRRYGVGKREKDQWCYRSKEYLTETVTNN